MFRRIEGNPHFQLLMSLLFGSIIGGLTFVFVEILTSINAVQANLNSTTPFHLLVAPVALALIVLIKRNSLFFPSKISELQDQLSTQHWSKAMFPVNFIGPIISHVGGLSLGREGAVVMFSASLARVFNLSWNFWGPILASIGFSAVVGNYWVAPFFMSELFFRTRLLQKLYSFVGAVVAVMVTRHLQMPHLFSDFEVNDNIGFFTKFLFLFLFAVSVGYIMRIYKSAHEYLVQKLLTMNLVFKISAVLILIGLLYLPELRKYQSLGLNQFYQISAFQADYLDAFLKLLLTLPATALGFMGGEFIPLVYSGVHFGGSFFRTFGYDPALGAAFGAFLFFAAGTRLKWTGYILMISLLGWEWWFWVYFVLSSAVSFSGGKSLYGSSEKTSWAL